MATRRSKTTKKKAAASRSGKSSGKKAVSARGKKKRSGKKTAKKTAKKKVTKKKTTKKGAAKKTKKKSAVAPGKKKTGRKSAASGRKKTTSRPASGKTASSRKKAKKKPARPKRAPAHRGLAPSKLTREVKGKKPGFRNTSELESLNDIVGQKRALKALELGVKLGSSGYNIYVSGMAGTGKMSTVRRLLDQIRPHCPKLRDFVYVYNFQVPNEPILITLPQKMGRVFAGKMERILQVVRDGIPKTLQGEGILDQKEGLAKLFLDQQKELFTNLEKELKEAGFVLSQVKIGSVVRPEVMIPVGEEIYPFEQLSTMVEVGDLDLGKEVDMVELEKSTAQFRRRLRSVMKESRRLNNTMVERLEALDREIAGFLISDHIEDLQEEYSDNPKIVTYLDQYKENVLGNLGVLKAAYEQGDDDDGYHGPGGAGFDSVYLPYQVNVVHDNSKAATCPIVLETNPTYNNVFGTVERSITQQGQTVTDFTRITAGSLLKADGGYLVLNAQDALTETGLWKTLKRVLIHRELVIQGIEGLLQLSTVNLKPEPISVDVTVILIGPPQLYFMLDRHDEEFGKIFKVRADFDHVMPLSGETVEYYGRFVAQMTEREDTVPFTAKGVNRLVEHGIRTAGGRKKITTRFGEIADVIRESSFWAKSRDEKLVNDKMVEYALEERRDRLRLFEEKVRERFKEGIVLVDTRGERVGQVNGLAVYAHGQNRFGIPSRITVSVARGKAGIINIERESRLSGNSHDKGVMILSGFLREQFTQDIPLSLIASICFEQSYGGVDGDSASSTELYALLSALANIPIRQNFAVTGSVNQKGDVQAIGGVNEKIEGFFDLCRSRGLTGDQGVLIPESNVGDLMLHSGVRNAVKRRKFHIHSVTRIEEGIEILTGVRAGKRNVRGEWERGTIFHLVQERLKKLDASPHSKGRAPVRKKKKISGKKK